jgi:hypothetical protein
MAVSSKQAKYVMPAQVVEIWMALNAAAAAEPWKLQCMLAAWDPACNIKSLRPRQCQMQLRLTPIWAVAYNSPVLNHCHLALMQLQRTCDDPRVR